MNKFMVLAGLFLVCGLLNLLNVFTTGNGFSLIMGFLWVVASIFCLGNARKMRKTDNQEEGETQEDTE